jgi:hypothetical protein
LICVVFAGEGGVSRRYDVQEFESRLPPWIVRVLVPRTALLAERYWIFAVRLPVSPPPVEPLAQNSSE